jgi:hypothetical protein
MAKVSKPNLSESNIEESYLERLREMTGLQKTQRMCEMIRMARWMMESQIKKAEPNLGERELQLKVAERIYASDKRTQELIQMAWKAL